MAEERAEPTRSHSLERCWELQLQAIDPSVQVCPEVIVPMGVGVGGRGLGTHVLALCLKDAWEPCLIPEHQGCFRWLWGLHRCLSS